MAKTYKVILTPYAQNRLQEITEYLLENVSYEVANKVLNGILDSIDTLEKLPDAHAVEHEISTKKQVYRKIFKWEYKIIYTVKETQIEVVVVEIMHSKQNSKSLKERYLILQTIARAINPIRMANTNFSSSGSNP